MAAMFNVFFVSWDCAETKNQTAHLDSTCRILLSKRNLL